MFQPSTSAIVLLLTFTTATAQPAAQACSGAEHRQFDFWIGRWEVFNPEGKKAGDNLVEAIDGGCALIERWQGMGGFTGTSLNNWDRATGQWRQHWVDNQGGQLRLAGGFEGGKMVLASTEPEPHSSRPSATVRQRISWMPLPDGAVRQHWERSEDGGTRWTTVFDGRYVKKKS